MKFTSSGRFGFLAAGSLSAVALALALIPFNMGGCSTSNLSLPAGLPGIPSGGGMNYAQMGAGAMTIIQSQTISDEAEVAIGQSVALEAMSRYPLYRDRELTRYVTMVARTVGSVSSFNGLKWYVGILDTDEVNAFSGPAGYIFVTRGALKRMHDESELAGVLGHEIGHVCKQHGLQAVKSSNFFKGLSTLAAGSDQRIAAFKNATDTATQAIIINGFSVAQEKEADGEGVKYAFAAGYDPNGFLHFLQRIRQEQGSGGKPFGTHPGLDERINLVSIQISKIGPSNAGMTLADRFAHNDDGTPRKF